MRRATAFAPGRVNLIGEHTDYNDGLACRSRSRSGSRYRHPAPGPAIEAHALDLGERDRFDRADPGRAPRRRPGWRRSSAARWPSWPGPAAAARLPPEIAGDVPRGAGLSSSAALSVALCMAFGSWGGAEPADGLELARLCSRIENDWVGARTGLLDQLASIHGREGCALRIDFREPALSVVPLDLAQHRLAVLPSGATASTPSRATTAARRVRACARAARRGVAARRGDVWTGRRCPTPSGGACGTSSARTRAWTRWSPRSTPETSTRPGSCSTPRTGACATTSRSPRPRWSAHASAGAPRARSAHA